jgi:O-antigen ligase
MASATEPRGRRFGFRLYAAHILTIFTLAGSNALLALTVLTAPWTVRGGGQGRRFRHLLWPVAAYLVLLGFSIALSYDPAASREAMSDVFHFATPVLALWLVRRERDARVLVTGIVVLATVIGLYGLVQAAVGFDNLGNRITGPFSHYMTFAGILLMADALLMARLGTGEPSQRRLWPGAHPAWGWISLGVINGALLASLTRNAWIGAAAAAVTLLWFTARRRLLVLLPMAALALWLAPPTISSRVTSIFDLSEPSNYDRVCMTYAGLHMVAERPFFGLGPEMVSERYALYRHPTAPRYWVPHLHSSYLNLAAERGLLSLMAFGWLLAATALTALRRLRQEGGLGGARADLYGGVLLALLALGVAGLFEDYWRDTEVQRVFLFLLALPFALGKGREGEENPQKC